MKKLKIAFDIDDTMIVPSVVTGDRDTPNYETIALYKWFQNQGNHMILWSGSGMDWAKTWGEKLGLQPDEIRVKEKSLDVDICFDDCDVDLATVNVKVSRFDNNVSRKEWNTAKKLDNDILGQLQSRNSDIRGRMTEWICPHGIGHHNGAHGCDGCCGLPENKEIMDKTTKE